MQEKTVSIAPKRAAAVILAAAAALAALVLLMTRGGVLSAHYNVTATQGRAEYLAAQGWTVDPETETEQTVTLPRSFTGVFEEYNEVQLQQGFDLRPYGGMTVTVCTYLVTNYDADSPVLATLYLYRNRVIAGDIHATAMDGFLHGIRKG